MTQQERQAANAKQVSLQKTIDALRIENAKLKTENNALRFTNAKLVKSNETLLRSVDLLKCEV